jgi:hypothetical protein
MASPPKASSLLIDRPSHRKTNAVTSESGMATKEITVESNPTAGANAR